MDSKGGANDSVIRLLRHVADTPGAALAVIDSNATVLFASDQLQLMLGYPTGGLNGMEFGALMSDTTSFFRNELPTTLTDLGTVQLQHTSGALVWANVSIVPAVGSPGGAWVVTAQMSKDRLHQQQLSNELVVEQYCHSLCTDLIQASSAAEVSERLQHACAEIGQLTNSHTVSFALDRPQRDDLVSQAHWMHPDFVEIGAATRTPRSEGPQWRDAVLEREFVVDDVTKPPYSGHSVLQRIRDLGAFLTVPVMVGSQQGVFVLTRRTGPHRWRGFDIQIARAASSILAAALHRSYMQQLWQLTFERGPIGFSIRTTEGQLVECNQQYLDMYDHEPALVENIDVFERIHSDDVEVLRAALDRLARPEQLQVSYELRVAQTDGEFERLVMTTTEVDQPGGADPLRLTAVQRHESNRPASGVS